MGSNSVQSAGLHNAVLLLPRLVPRLHDTGIQQTLDQNPRAWDVVHVIKQVEALVNLTGLTTLPSLEEWAVLADKVRCTLSSELASNIR